MAIAKARQEIKSNSVDFIGGTGLALDAYAIIEVAAQGEWPS